MIVKQPCLFQHMGINSSLKGKIQKIKNHAAWTRKTQRQAKAASTNSDYKSIAHKPDRPATAVCLLLIVTIVLI